MSEKSNPPTEAERLCRLRFHARRELLEHETTWLSHHKLPLDLILPKDRLQTLAAQKRSVSHPRQVVDNSHPKLSRKQRRLIHFTRRRQERKAAQAVSDQSPQRRSRSQRQHIQPER